MSERADTSERVDCRIGGLDVALTVTGRPLPATLSRLSVLSGSGEASPAVRLRIEVSRERDWGLTSRTGPDLYTLGRPSHHVAVDCRSGEVAFRIPEHMDRDDLYWFQRDLFACLGSLSADPLLHGSAVVHAGRAYVFCASSGVGKTTVAELLSAHARMVNDETNWIRLGGPSGPELVNQCFWLTAGQSVADVPLAGVFFLERGDRCQVKPCSLSAEVFSLLLAVHLPFDATDPFLPARSSAVVKLARTAPLYSLRFRRDRQELETVVYGIE